MTNGQECGQWIEGGGVASPLGFRASGIHCGIKQKRLDLALLEAHDSVPTVGMYTTNRVVAAPVTYCREALASSPTARAVVINSGNANACTGEQGWSDTVEMAGLVAASLGVDPAEVLVASTGVIGRTLPMEKIRSGVEDIVAGLSDSGGGDAAAAIMTTDTVPKECALEVELSTGRVIVGGMTKGSGMIAPDLELPGLPHATTLGFLTTDALVEPGDLAPLLEGAMRTSYNAITVDSDTSTNDTVLLMASGSSGVQPSSDDDLARLAGAVEAVALKLALDIVRDGEGANRLIEARVRGARTRSDAERIARSVADSPLVKTAFCEGEPNWGRLMMAVGKAGVDIDPSRIDISVGDLQVVRNGLGTAHDPAVLRTQMTLDDVLIDIDLRLGADHASVYTCDLSEEYVRINSTYLS